MYTVRNGALYFNEVKLGPSNALYADRGELRTLGEEDGVRHLQTPGRIDIIFVAGERVVGAESKKPDDLVTSTLDRRLARQMRMIMRLTDVPALILRGNLPDFNDWGFADVIVNLVRLQCLGVVLLPCPSRDEEARDRLAEYRTFLASGSRSALAAVSGSDNKLKRPGTIVSRVSGLGAGRADALMRLAIEKSTDEELAKAVAGKKMVQRLREVVQ